MFNVQLKWMDKLSENQSMANELGWLSLWIQGN